MKTALFSAVLLVVLCSTVSAQRTGTRFQYVFVGELISLNRIECYQTERVEPERWALYINPCFNYLYEATYRIHTSYLGGLEEGTEQQLRFTAVVGPPFFSDHQYALLAFRPVNALGHGELGPDEPVYPLAGGGFSGCGCSESDDYIYPPGSCRTQAFDPPMEQYITHRSPRYVQSLLEYGSYVIEGEIARCEKGIPADLMALDLLD